MSGSAYATWLTLERERQRQICLHALEPLRESAHRALIKAFLAEGNPGEAIRQYNLFRDILRRELQLDPSPHVTELVVGLSAP
jgi:DNA-binding SARP family transcriptional activator